MSRRDRASRTSLLVRNLPMDVRPDDVRYKFERYGEIRDIYLPRDYYNNRPKGFGFVEYCDPRDAEDALYGMDGKNFGGREIAVVMSKDSRKTPRDMAVRDDTTGRLPPRSSSHRRRTRSRSRSPRRSSHRSPRRRERSYSRSYSRSRSPPRRNDMRSPEREVVEEPAQRSASPPGSRSPQNAGPESDKLADASPRSQGSA